MVNNTEKCKALAGWMGICWHGKWIKKGCVTDADTWWECEFCGKDGRVSNPDYYTAEGRQVLLEWAVEREWWVDFEAKYSISLFIPVTTFADAVYEYLKERGNEQIR